MIIIVYITYYTWHLEVDLCTEYIDIILYVYELGFEEAFTKGLSRHFKAQMAGGDSLRRSMKCESC